MFWHHLIIAHLVWRDGIIQSIQEVTPKQNVHENLHKMQILNASQTLIPKKAL